MREERVYNPVREAARQRQFMLLALRAVVLVLMLGVALLHLFTQTQVPAGVDSWIPATAPLTVALVLFIGALLIDLGTPNKKLATLSGVFVGVLGGMVATFALTFLINLLLEAWIGDKQTLIAIRPYFDLLKLMLGIALCYLGVSTVLQTQDDFRLVIPYVEFAKQIRGVKPTLLDTSALIDARIVEISSTGLIQSTLVVPKFVVGELQMLADSADKLKRARGRRGLDVIGRLQRLGLTSVVIDDTPVTETGAVDQKLIELAQRLSARIMTTDLGLTRVAQIQGVQALNLHDAASAFRPALIPGEQLALRVVKLGEQPGQGVGYLEDGTMVVVDGGANSIGLEMSVLVTSTMQTSAGRMVFARVAHSIEPRVSSTQEGSASQVPLASTRVESHAHAFVSTERPESAPAPTGQPRSPEELGSSSITQAESNVDTPHARSTPPPSASPSGAPDGPDKAGSRRSGSFRNPRR